MIQTRLGILGGGQLARMLALSAHPLGLEVSALVTQPGEPAAQVIGRSQVGSLRDETDLRRFLSSLDFVTFESEFVDTEILARCLPKTCHAFPSLPVLATIQDRLTQKRLLDQYKIPTSPWLEVSNKKDLEAARSRFTKGFVLKQRRFGYDGYGTFVYNPGQAIDPSVLSKTEHGFIAEEFVSFRRELALSFVRSLQGDTRTLPLVQSVQVNSRCFSVCGPLTHRGLGGLSRRFQRLMKELDYRGILAVELFETSRGLVVNELAPRVHNSAHYSQEGLTCDQFEYHVRAGLGLSLPKVELVRPGFAMINLLGEGGRDVHLSRSAVGHLHWYGKSENRTGRKLGHVNVLANSAKEALARALKWRKEFKL